MEDLSKIDTNKLVALSSVLRERGDDASLQVVEAELSKRKPAKRSLGETLYENFVGSGEADTFGEKLGLGIRKFVDSASLGLAGDEFNAAVESAFLPGDYNDRLADLRANEAAFDAEHPIAAGIADIGGSLAGGVALGSLAAPLRIGGGLAGRLIGAGVEGMGLGAIDGYMRSDGERMADGMVGGAMGGAFGAAGRAGADLISGFAPTLREASRGILGAPMDQRAPIRVTDDALVSLGPTMGVAAMGGSSAARETIERGAASRMSGANRALGQKLDETLGPVQDVNALSDDILNTAQREAKPLYDAAYKAPMPQQIKDLMTRVPDDVRGAVKRTLQQDGQAPGTYREADLAQRSLGDKGEASKGQGAFGGMTTEGASAVSLGSEIIETAKALNPQFGQAVERMARAGDDQRALRIGEQAASGKVEQAQLKEMAAKALRQPDLAESFRNMTPEQQQLVRTGARAKIDSVLQGVLTGKLDVNQLRMAEQTLKMFASKDVRRNARILLGQDAAALIPLVRRIRSLAYLQRKLGGGNPGAREARVPGNDNLVGRIFANPTGFVREMFSSSPQEVAKLTAQQYERVANALIRLQGPEARMALGALRRAQEAERDVEPLLDIVAGVLVRTGAAMGAEMAPNPAGRY